MKRKIVLMAILMCALSAQATQYELSKPNQTDVVLSRTVEASLTDEEYGQRLFLYSDGTCVIRYADNSTSAGTYDIQGTKIRFNWGEGTRTQQGNCSFRNGQLEYVSVEGYTFKQRIVTERKR